VNGGALKPSEIDPGAARPGAERAPDDADDEIRRAWATALCAAVPPDPLQPVRAAAGADATPGGWRPSDVSMTEFGDHIEQTDPRLGGTTGVESGASVVSRLSTVVSAGHLGRVEFVVDRSNAGLSIVVEVSGDAAARAVDADRQTLLRTLRSAGLTVLSFRILVRGGPGTALAERTLGQHAKSNSQSRMRYLRPTLEDGPDGDADGLDVVG
jgi:hypothetical protein